MESGVPTNFDPALTVVARRHRTVPAYLVSRLISSYMGYLVVMGVLVLLVPWCSDKNAKFQGPAATVMLFKISAMCIHYYMWAYLLPLPALWAVANFNIADKTRRRRLRLGAFVFVMAFLLFTLLALFLPMFHRA